MEIYTSAFSEVLSNTKLLGVWTTYDFSELVEWFARSCQSSSQVEHGWFYIYKLVDHNKQVLPILLLFRANSYELADLKKLKRLSKDLFNSALQKVLQLFCPMLEEGVRYRFKLQTQCFCKVGFCLVESFAPDKMMKYGEEVDENALTVTLSKQMTSNSPPAKEDDPLKVLMKSCVMLKVDKLSKTMA